MMKTKRKILLIFIALSLTAWQALAGGGSGVTMRSFDFPLRKTLFMKDKALRNKNYLSQALVSLNTKVFNRRNK